VTALPSESSIAGRDLIPPTGDRDLQPPVDAVLPDRHPEAPAPGEVLPPHYRMCFGCGPDHPTGLRMRIEAGPGLSVVGQFIVTEDHQGAPGLAHGGVLALAFDEVLGYLTFLIGRPAVTARLQASFRRPVPVGSALHITANVLGTTRRKIYTAAEGRLDGIDGPVGMSAAALFIAVPLDHFVRHGRRDDIDRVIADPDSVTISSTFEVNP
jgi:acyl-coenzyme A thioesterase PaaI-like protein